MTSRTHEEKYSAPPKKQEERYEQLIVLRSLVVEWILTNCFSETMTDVLLLFFSFADCSSKFQLHLPFFRGKKMTERSTVEDTCRIPENDTLPPEPATHPTTFRTDWAQPRLHLTFPYWSCSLFDLRPRSTRQRSEVRH